MNTKNCYRYLFNKSSTNKRDGYDIYIYMKYFHLGLVWFMMFNDTFYNISVISWRSVSLPLMAETGVPWRKKKHRPVESHWQTFTNNVVSSTLHYERDSNLQLQIGTDCTGSCKSNYYTITTTMAPVSILEIFKDMTWLTKIVNK